MELTITHESDWTEFEDGSSELVIGPYTAHVTVSYDAREHRTGIDATVYLTGSRTIARCNDVANFRDDAQSWCENTIRDHAQ